MKKANLILGYFLTLVLLVVMVWGCKSKKKPQTKTDSTEVVFEKKSDETYSNLPSVNLTVKILEPYCKGVAPQSEEEYNYHRPEPNSLFYISKSEANSDFKLDFKTDENGTFEVFLKPGKYCVKRKEKDIDFESFYRKNSGTDSEYHTYGDKDCFLNWWNNCEGAFEVMESNRTYSFEVVISPRCFTGENPCKYYRGPLPP